MQKKTWAFILALGMNIFTIPVLPVEASNQMETTYVDLSDEVYQEGGYLSSRLPEITTLSLSQEERMEVLKEKLMDAWCSFAPACDISGYGLTLDEIRSVYREILNEDYRYFYVNAGFGYSYYPNGEIISINITYNMSKAEAETKLADLEIAISKALYGTDPSWSDMEKALYINDYLARTCEYDTTLTKFTAYDALVEKTAVCQGYSLAYQLLAGKLGLRCEIVTSESLNHAWNLIKIGNDYFHVDATWNDPLKDRLGRARHRYFMKSSSYFNSDDGGHIAQDWVISDNLDQSVAGNTAYDSYFWDDIMTGFEYVDGNWYGIEESAIYKYVCDGNRFIKISTVQSIDATWRVWGSGTSYWSGSYASLASYNGMLYYSLTDAIYQYDLSTEESSVIYSLSEEQKAKGYIYGMRILANGEVDFLLATSPNLDGEVGIYKADRLIRTPVLISDCTITLENTSYNYDGTEKTPSVTVANGNSVLVNGLDYSISYSNHRNAGKATVTISGIGNYTGSVTKNFTISKADQTVTASVRKSEIITGSTTAITANGIGIITYTSDNTDVAVVNSGGIVTGVSAGTAVITVTAAGDNNYNSAEKSIIVTVQYTAPSILSVSNINGGMQIKWETVSGADKYRVYRKTTSGGSWERVAETIETCYTDKMAVSGTTYSYTVCCIDAAGINTSDYDEVGKSMKYLETPSLSSVSNVKAGVTVKWGEVIGADGYYVFRKTASGSWKRIKIVTGRSTTAFTDTTVKSGTTYYYTLQAYSGTALSSYLSAGKRIVSLSQPVPSLSNTSGGVKIVWSKVTGAAGYYVYRRIGTGNWTKIRSTTSTTYTDTTAKNGTTYSYMVKAYKGTSASTYNTTKKIVRLKTPSIRSVSNNAKKKIIVKWATNASATGYQIQYVTGSITKTVAISRASSVSKIITGLIKGKTYKVYIRSYKTISGTKYYSARSSAKAVRILK